MTVYHVFYIPAVLFVGLFLGAILGRRQLMQELAEQERAERARQKRREERQRKRSGRMPEGDASTERNAAASSES